jgi:hypothetical protein
MASDIDGVENLQYLSAQPMYILLSSRYLKLSGGESKVWGLGHIVKDQKENR